VYDTEVLTQKGRNNVDFRLKNLQDWDQVKQGDEIKAYKKKIPLNAKDGKHNGTLFLGYSRALSSVKTQVALPKLVYGSSLYEIQENDKDKVNGKLQDLIKDWIDIDLDEMKVYRLDNSCNLELSQKTSKYINALNQHTEQTIGHQNKKLYDGETISWNTKTGSFTNLFYDKVKRESHLTKGEYDPEAYKFLDKNILRYEIQMNKPATMLAKSRFGRRLSHKDIFMPEVIAKVREQRKQEYNKIMKEAKQKYALDYSSIQKDLEIMKETNKRRATSDFAWYLIRRADLLSVDDIKRLMLDAGYSKQAVYSKVKKIRQLDKLRAEDRALLDELLERIKQKAVA